MHGYNVDFKSAALRTAQIAVDLDADSVPVLYSWPSQGGKANYTDDETNAEWTEANFRAFLEAFADNGGSDEIVVIAHSMGSRAATRALSALLSKRRDLAPRFKELILAAPDIDAAVFVCDLMPAYKELRRPVTLYVSSNDKALVLSRMVHAREPRAGDSSNEVVIAPGVETVDASSANTDFLGHGAFADTRTILTDMTLLMRKGMRASERPGLMSMSDPRGAYWAFKP